MAVHNYEWLNVLPTFESKDECAEWFFCFFLLYIFKSCSFIYLSSHTGLPVCACVHVHMLCSDFIKCLVLGNLIPADIMFKSLILLFVFQMLELWMEAFSSSGKNSHTHTHAHVTNGILFPVVFGTTIHEFKKNKIPAHIMWCIIFVSVAHYWCQSDHINIIII